MTCTSQVNRSLTIQLTGFPGRAGIVHGSVQGSNNTMRFNMSYALNIFRQAQRVMASLLGLRQCLLSLKRPH